MTRSTRLYHPHRFILPNSSTYSYQQSFFSKDWNNLPSSIIESNNIDFFSAELQTLYELNNCNLCNYVAKFIIFMIAFFPEHISCAVPAFSQAIRMQSNAEISV